jgi:hypothetical protein
MYLLNLKFYRLIEDNMNYSLIFFIKFLMWFFNMKARNHNLPLLVCERAAVLSDLFYNIPRGPSPRARLFCSGHCRESEPSRGGQQQVSRAVGIAVKVSGLLGSLLLDLIPPA